MRTADLSCVQEPGRRWIHSLPENHNDQGNLLSAEKKNQGVWNRIPLFFEIIAAF